jgi:hypothetical protein
VNNTDLKFVAEKQEKYINSFTGTIADLGEETLPKWIVTSSIKNIKPP